jgi:hypothetical protein
VPRYSGDADCSIKFGVPSKLRQAFQKRCKDLGVSQVFILRSVVETFMDESKSLLKERAREKLLEEDVG